MSVSTDHKVAGKTAHDQSTWPPGMKNVEIMRLIFREKCRNQWIHHSFGNSITNGEQKHAPEQALISPTLTTSRIGCTCQKCQKGRDDVHRKSSCHELAETDFISQQG